MLVLLLTVPIIQRINSSSSENCKLLIIDVGTLEPSELQYTLQPLFSTKEANDVQV